MAVKTRAELKAENSADFPDNRTRRISPGHLRGQMDDLVDSAAFPEDGVATAASIATQVVTVTEATYTIASGDHNKILDCTHVSGCFVTVPPALTSGIDGVLFTCGLSKGESAGNVTVVEEGSNVRAPGGLFVMATQYGMMTLTQWPDGTLRLFGGNA